MRSMIFGCVVWVALVAPAMAQMQSKYQISDAERAACEPDAVSLCSAAYPDEDALLVCMKLNVDKLTTRCRPVFVEGLRRRGLR